MSKVYLAVHQDVPNLKVILKILSNPRLGERFRHEADKLALLDGHPNICRIKHFFNHGEDTVIAMEYIEGITLDEKIKTEGQLPVEESLQIISEVLDILDFAHGKGVYHRDIKPSNIMIDKKGQVKIIDFGIAKSETDPNLTIAGTACGTPAYMAPEQFSPTADTDYALVDIYAVGTTLYKILVGECPYKGDNEFAIRDAKLFSDPPKPRKLNPDIPKQLDEVIMKSLSRDPQARYQSASEMQSAIDALRRSTGEAASPRPVDVTIDVGPIRKRKSRKPLLAVVALILVAIAVYAVYHFSGSKTGTIEISVIPYGDVYVDGSLLGQNVTGASLTSKAGTHVVHVRNEEATERALYDTVWLAADTVLALAFDFTAYLLPTTGTIDISVAPDGDIYVDDSLLGRKTAQASLTCDTGMHLIRVENKNATRKVLHDTVWLAADQVVPLTYQFTISKPPPVTTETKPVFKKVVVVTKPRGADVYIDGELQKEKTNYTFRLSYGEHIVKVKLTRGGEELEQQRSIEVTKHGPDKVVFDLEK